MLYNEVSEITPLRSGVSRLEEERPVNNRRE